MSTVRRSKSEIHYPESDGKPMGETGIHVNSTMDLFTALKKTIFGNRPDVYVAADMFFYFEEGNPKAVKAPDVMVIKGVSHPEERRTFKLWVEGVAPCVIFEVTSPKTRRDDVVVKRELYSRLGVAEYYLFDPLGEYLKPRFQALRLAGSEYVEIEPDADGGFLSPELGHRLLAVGRRLHVLDPVTGAKIISFDDLDVVAHRFQSLEREIDQARKSEEKFAQQAEREKKKADAERLKADAERLKADAERFKAEAERFKAEAERFKAETERQRADGYEAEINRLRALLGEGGKPPQA